MGVSENDREDLARCGPGTGCRCLRRLRRADRPRGYRRTPGNRGAWLLRRTEGDRTEIVALSFWDSQKAIEGFAGEDIGKAVFYPEDDRFLVERDLRVTHYEVPASGSGTE
jgi:heme-degrading monooxygenase HmoA